MHGERPGILSVIRPGPNARHVRVWYRRLAVTAEKIHMTENGIGNYPIKAEHDILFLRLVFR